MKKISIVILVFLSMLQINASNLDINEDELIMKAIYYSEHNQPKDAAKIWKKLFENSNKESYLVEYFYTSLQFKKINEVIKELKASLAKKKNEELYELLASLYQKEGNTDALLEMLEDRSSSNDIESLYQIAYLYSIKGKYDKALKIYKQIYNKDKSWNALKGILSILAKQNKINEASNILWDAIHKNQNLPNEALLVYAGLIDLKKDNKKAIYIFNKLYSKTKDKKYIKQLISLYLYNKDYDSIIKILEKSRYDDKLLYELYLSKKRAVDAYMLLDSLYNKTKNPKWLAEKAILTYEIASNLKAVDKRVVDRVDELFEKALKKGVRTPTYLNYYGYTLIDNDVDIKKGIKLIKEALKGEPDNIYYLDSLAWGYYKLKDCKKAKEIMKKIKEIESQNLEDEILKHQKAIDECKE